MKKIMSVSFVLFFAISLANANEITFEKDNQLETNIGTAIDNADASASWYSWFFKSQKLSDDVLGLFFKGLEDVEYARILKIIPGSGIRKITKENVGEVLFKLSETDEGFKLLTKTSWLSDYNQDEMVFIMKTFDDSYKMFKDSKKETIEVFEEAIIFTKNEIALYGHNRSEGLKKSLVEIYKLSKDQGTMISNLIYINDIVTIAKINDAIRKNLRDFFINFKRELKTIKPDYSLSDIKLVNSGSYLEIALNKNLQKLNDGFEIIQNYNLINSKEMKKMMKAVESSSNKSVTFFDLNGITLNIKLNETTREVSLKISPPWNLGI